MIDRHCKKIFLLIYKTESILDRNIKFAGQQAKHRPIKELLQGFLSCKYCVLCSSSTRHLILHPPILIVRTCTSCTAIIKPRFGKRLTLDHQKFLGIIFLFPTATFWVILEILFWAGAYLKKTCPRHDLIWAFGLQNAGFCKICTNETKCSH